MSPLLAQSRHCEKRNRCCYWGQSGHGLLQRICRLLVRRLTDGRTNENGWKTLLESAGDGAAGCAHMRQKEQ
jgi:hypothetical protein